MSRFIIIERRKPLWKNLKCKPILNRNQASNSCAFSSHITARSHFGGDGAKINHFCLFLVRITGQFGIGLFACDCENLLSRLSPSIPSYWEGSSFTLPENPSSWHCVPSLLRREGFWMDFNSATLWRGSKPVPSLSFSKLYHLCRCHWILSSFLGFLSKPLSSCLLLIC